MPQSEWTFAEEILNSHINLRVQRLSLTMNKEKYELGKADINMFQSVVDLRNGNFSINGQLGSMSILDQSPYGHLYRERFITMGTQALDFKVATSFCIFLGSKTTCFSDRDCAKEYIPSIHII